MSHYIPYDLTNVPTRMISGFKYSATSRGYDGARRMANQPDAETLIDYTVGCCFFGKPTVAGACHIFCLNAFRLVRLRFCSSLP